MNDGSFRSIATSIDDLNAGDDFSTKLSPLSGRNASAALEIGIIVTAATLGWLAVRRGLHPQVDLGREIDKRQFWADTGLKRLDLKRIPYEVHPPIRAMNELFVRLEAAMQVIRDFIADAYTR